LVFGHDLPVVLVSLTRACLPGAGEASLARAFVRVEGVFTSRVVVALVGSQSALVYLGVTYYKIRSTVEKLKKKHRT